MDEPVTPALLIIKTWREDGSEPSFRAQIRVATDISSGSSSTINLAEPDRVLEVVRAFLYEGASGGGVNRRPLPDGISRSHG